MAPQCSICVQRLLEFQKLLAPECGHVFHSECLQRWIQRSTKCPHCQQQMCADRVMLLHLASAKVPAERTLPLRQRVDELKLAVQEKDKVTRQLVAKAKENEVLKGMLEQVTTSRDAISRELRSIRHANERLNDRLMAVQREESNRRRHAETQYRLAKQKLRRLQRTVKEPSRNDAFTQTGCAPSPFQKSRTLAHRMSLTSIQNILPASLLRVPTKRPGLSADANLRRRCEPNDPLADAYRTLSRPVPIIKPMPPVERNSKIMGETVVTNIAARKRQSTETAKNEERRQRKIEEFFAKRKH